MLFDEDEPKNKFNEEEEQIKVLSEDPNLAIAHGSKLPSVIHFPKHSKSAHCSQQPGAHAKKRRLM